MKEKNTAVAVSVTLFLAIRILGASLIPENPVASTVVQVLVLLLSVALPACLFIGTQLCDRQTVGFSMPKRDKLSYLLFLPLFIVTVSLAATVCTEIAKRLGYHLEMNLPSDIPRLVLLAAVLPAVVEEIFCRYLCLTPYARDGRATAVWISAILFACLHINPIQIPYALLGGLLLGALAVSSQSILIPIIFHLCNNLCSVTFRLLGEGMASDLLEWSLIALAALSLPLLLRGGAQHCLLSRLLSAIRPDREEARSLLQALLSPLLFPILLCLWLTFLP